MRSLGLNDSRGRGSAVDFICEFLHVLAVSARLLSANAVPRPGVDRLFKLVGQIDSKI